MTRSPFASKSMIAKLIAREPLAMSHPLGLISDPPLVNFSQANRAAYTDRGSVWRWTRWMRLT
jgi:hypothetical protein